MKKKRFKKVVKGDCEIPDVAVGVWFVYGLMITFHFAYNLFKFQDYNLVWLFVPWFFGIFIYWIYRYYKYREVYWEEE